jgi:2-amino-4-hydroxy-6-hydroxymethyldihydropteridine diphosphokinase
MAQGEAVFLGLGSNVGNREAHLRRALEVLGRLVHIERLSSVWRSAPVGYASQPDFWNLVVQARSPLPPLPLLDRLQQIERELGRRPSFRNGPRSIDIDLLFYDMVQMDDGRLHLPHPRLLSRGFTLRPLAELQPELRHPRTGRTITEHLREAQNLERDERLFAGDRLLAGTGSTPTDAVASGASE